MALTNDNSSRVPAPSLACPTIAEQKNNLSICSYNCRSIKNGTTEVYALCTRFDIVVIQEHMVVAE